MADSLQFSHKLDFAASRFGRAPNKFPTTYAYESELSYAYVVENLYG